MPARPSHALPDAALEMIAARFRLLSEPARLRLIIALEAGERNVGDLVQITGTSQTNVSRHLQVLAEGGVLSRRKSGASVFYRIADPAVFDLCRHVCGGLARELREKGEVSKLFRL